MGPIGFYIYYIFNWVIMLLPMPFLYIFSDFLFLILYYFPSYRRDVVSANLRNSFPEKSAEEIHSIERKFYRHLADLFVEIPKLAHMGKAQAIKRATMTNPELLDRLYSEGRDIAAVMAHYNNWEWLQSIIYYTDYQTVSIYKPLQNKQFDRFMLQLRQKRGMILTPMSNIIRTILGLRNINRRGIYSFISDQTPPVTELKFWTTFLNQDTPVFTGVEKVAIKYDMAVLFFNVQKIKRGYYTYTAEILFEHTAGLPESTITEGHVRRLEELIREKPEFWIWSHKRWKHKRQDSK
jgi:Kdo2-lipid IVA lauroyltransferase/acyltransferase